MDESEPPGSRGKLLARAERFTDMMLDRLNAGSSGKDADEAETRMLGNVVLKALKIWESALHDDKPAAQARKKTFETRKED